MREPARKEYLLDLVLTDIQNTSIRILPYVADHKGVLATLPCMEILEMSFEREVWHLAAADWGALEKALRATEWRPLRNGTAEDALAHFQEVLWFLLIKFVLRRTIKVVKRSHPWLNERSQRAIQRKNDAENSESFIEKQKECAKVLAEERVKYVQQLKKKLAKLPKSSKQWWRINRELLNKKSRLTSIPTLRDDGKWLINSKSKADAFANIFSSKSEFPPEAVDTPYFG